jgi:hypothetical protein
MTDAVDTLARTIWGEARGDGVVGMTAVAAVVLNRAAHPRWWGHDIASCCLAPWQFSCWNSDDPNLPKMRAATAASEMFPEALAIAADAVAGKISDPTGGADSYFAIGTPVPSWASMAKFTRRILHHAFYRVELGAPPGNQSMYSPPAVRVAVGATTDDLNAMELARIQAADQGVSA